MILTAHIESTRPIIVMPRPRKGSRETAPPKKRAKKSNEPEETIAGSVPKPAEEETAAAKTPPTASPVARPVASPAASPAASPVASLAASPVASPVPSDEAAQRSKPAVGKGQGKKGKSKGTLKEPRTKYTLDPEQEEQVLEWMREHDEVWRRGHKKYKMRRLVWATKAEELGVTVDYLEHWWKSIKDWFVKLKKLPASGSAARQPTDREQFILTHCSFYSVQQARSNSAPAPLIQLARSAIPDVVAESDSEDDLSQSQVITHIVCLMFCNFICAFYIVIDFVACI